METKNITYKGPPVGDMKILNGLPSEITSLFVEMNGFILLRGALHVRGACHNPAWHSIRNVLSGSNALHMLYPAIRESDIPFGQDCVGDQFVLRDGSVYRLTSETGELESLELSFEQFIQAAITNPDDTLMPHALYQFEDEGNVLEPGQLLSVYPPYCTKESANGVTLKATSAEERIRFLASIARQISNLPEGTKIRFEISE